MIEIPRILCPIDFSEFSEHAFEHALAIARWYGSRVTLLHVFTNWPAVNIIPSLDTTAITPVPLRDIDRDELVRQMERVVERHPAPGVHIETLVQEAPNIHREILAQAEGLHADLVVIGSHGRSGFERLLLGSVTEKVLRKATCPVMVIPRRASTAASSAASHFSRILCPVDFSDGSMNALTFAISLAEEADARLTLLHVIEMPPELLESSMAADFNVAEARARAEADCLRRLRALVPDSVRTYCTVDAVVVEGKAYREILELAAARTSDLIVMGVQGRGAVDLLVFGSNTHHVIRSATCPVLTVRGPAVKSSTPRTAARR